MSRLLLVPPLLVTLLQPAVAEEKPARKETFVPLPERFRGAFVPTPDEARVPKRFRQEAYEFDSTAKLLRDRGPVRVYDVRFPSPVETDVAANNTVHARYFQPPGKDAPACVVLHILGGEFPLTDAIAETLARRGVAALAIRMPYYGARRGESRRRMIVRDPKATVANVTQAVLDVRRGAAWLASRPEVDPDRLGITGISLGGIMTALSGAIEPRFQRVAVVLGGGAIARMIWEHRHRDAEVFRRQWKAAGGTRESFFELLDPVDPVTHAHRLRDRDVLMIAAKYDKIVTPASVLALWKAVDKRPELVWLEAGHVSAAAYLFTEVERLGKFLSAE